MKMSRKTAKYKLCYYKRNHDIFKELKTWAVLVQIIIFDNECIKHFAQWAVPVSRTLLRNVKRQDRDSRTFIEETSWWLYWDRQMPRDPSFWNYYYYYYYYYYHHHHHNNRRRRHVFTLPRALIYSSLALRAAHFIGSNFYTDPKTFRKSEGLWWVALRNFDCFRPVEV